MKSGYKVKNEKVASAAAAQLLKRPEVQAEITRIQGAVRKRIVKSTEWTKEKVLKEFGDLLHVTKKEKSFATAARCLENVGKIVGVYEEDNKQKIIGLEDFVNQIQSKIGIVTIDEGNQ